MTVAPSLVDVVTMPLVPASVRYSVSVMTLRRWIKLGKLKAYQPGRALLVDVSELEELIRSKVPSSERTHCADGAAGVGDR